MALETQHLQNIDDSNINEQILPKGAILQNRYEILKILGSGGMGSVYLARDLNFAKIQRMCAIKEMISATPDPNFRKISLANFEREANILANMNHPAIVKIYDYFSESNRSYLVMEYIKGKDLEEIVNSLPEGRFLPEERILNWGIQICDILSFLHESEQPIVYRDLKPPNLMLRFDNSDTLMLIDFGIAKAFQEGQKGTMMGTEGYSPPEQYRGIASPQGDVYALGATLHHLLTRRDPKLEPPFSFHEAPPSKFNSAVSEITEHAVMKALNYDAKNRFDSASEMRKVLEQALEAKKNPHLQAGGFTPQAAHQPPPTQIHPQSVAPTPESLPYAQNQMGVTPVTPPIEVPNINSGIIPVWSFKCEDEIRSSPTLGNGMVFIGVYDNNVYAIDAKSGKFQWKYATDGGIASTPCFYKDKVIFGSEDKLVYAITSHMGKILWTCPTGDRIRSSVKVDFEHAFFGSDDGKLYAANVQTGRVIWRFETGAPIRSTPAIEDEIVYVGCEDGSLYAVEMQTGKQKWKFSSRRGITSSPIIYKDCVLVGSQDGTLYAINKKSSWSVWRFRTNKPIFSSPKIKDGIAYFGGVDGYLYAMDAESGKNIWKFKAGSPIASSPAISNEAVYFGTSKGEVISVAVKNGKENWRFITEGTVPSSPALGEGVVYIGSTDHNLYALPA